MTGTGAICTPLHLRKPPPSWGLSLPVTHLQPATVGWVTLQAMKYVVQKKQSEEVGALRSSKKEVRRGHTCHGWVPTAEVLSARREHCRAEVVLISLMVQASS